MYVCFLSHSVWRKTSLTGVSGFVPGVLNVWGGRDLHWKSEKQTLPNCSLLLPNLSLRWHPTLFLEFPHQCPSLYLAPHSGGKAGHGHRLSHPVPGSFPSSKPTVDHNCYSVCVHSRPWRRFLHFSTKESTWLRCDIIASWESLPWEDLFGFSEVGCVLICICDTC